MGVGSECRQIRHSLAIGAAFAIFAAGIAAGSWWGALHIEDDLGRRAGAALRAAGLSASAHVSGRDAVLVGTVASADDLALAGIVVANVKGMRQVTSRLQIAPAPEPTPTATAPDPVSPHPPTPPKGRVLFASGKADVPLSAQKLLTAVAAYLGRFPTTTVRIEGHSDNMGPRTFNQDLSTARARAVARYLIAHGVAAERITTTGFADTRPVAPNRLPVGRAANRRVEIIIEGAD